MKAYFTLVTLLLAIFAITAVPASAQPDGLMTKCMVLVAINNLDLSYEQLNAMYSVADKVANERTTRHDEREASLEPIYQKLVAGDKMNAEEIHQEMQKDRVDKQQLGEEKREEMKQELDKIWAMLDAQQQEAIRNLPMPKQEKRGNKGQKPGMNEGQPQHPDGSPRYHGNSMDNDTNSDETLSRMDASVTNPQRQAGKKQFRGKGNGKRSENPGYRNLMRLLTMPGAANAMEDRLGNM